MKSDSCLQWSSAVLVVFSSLDLMLHSEALLSAIDFLSATLSSGRKSSPERDIRMKTDDKTPSAKSTTLVSPAGSDIIDLKVTMTLGAFNVLVCDQSCDMAHIKIQGLNGSLLMQGPQTHISARLKDFIVLNVDPNSFHKKAISIVGDEVFSFSLSLTPNATEGPGYADTSKTDGRLKLSVGCIQMVYLHKFIMSLLKFSNNFQTAKAALSAATAQAAAQAALSVKDFAQKSFRLSMDIKLKAPLIIVPQNSSSQHALVMDLGLITVGNSFSLMPADGCPLPAVLEKMEVQLTQLKLSVEINTSIMTQLEDKHVYHDSARDNTSIMTQLEINTSIMTQLEINTSIMTQLEINTSIMTQLKINTSIMTQLEINTSNMTQLEINTSIMTQLEINTSIMTQLVEINTSIMTQLEINTSIMTQLEINTSNMTQLEINTSIMTQLEINTSIMTQLEINRTCLDPDSDPAAGGGPGIELLEPVNLQLMVRRNLSVTWYKKMVAVEVDGDLKPMKVELSQEDLKVLLRILTENLGEAGGPENTDPRPEAVGQLGAAEPVAETGGEDQEDLENLRFNLNIESLGLVLYSNDPKQPLALQHQQELRLGELALHQLRVSGRIRSSDGLEVTAVLSGCTLDDLRTGMERASSRMVGRRDEDSAEAMIDRLYLCASVEFLMAVADFFLQALPQTPNTATSNRLPLRQTAKPRADTNTASPVRTRLRAVVLDPEVVFVASLMKADAPALVASFQCDFSMQLEEDGRQDMRANLRELRVLACPFIRDQEDAAVTTVLRPCSVALETKTVPNQPLSGCVTVEEVVLKGPSYGRASVINLPPPLLYPMEADSDDSSGKSSDEDLQRSAQEEITELYFKFEVKEVLFEMLREQSTVLSLSVCELGAEGRRRSFDLSVTAFLRRVALDFCDLPDGREPLHLVRSSETQNSDLLKVDFIKADPAGPSFKSLFHSTEQNLKVEVSSLDFLLHTKALLSTLSFLSSALPQRARAPPPEDRRPAGGTRSVSAGSQEDGVFSFTMSAVLGSFHVEVCDDMSSIADIRVTGLDASVSMQAGGQAEVFTRLRDIVVSDLKPGIVHRKAVSIVGGQEVFSFRLSLFPGATEGGGYSDMEKVDGKVTLRLGCIQILYLHQFLMALLRQPQNITALEEICMEEKLN
ncbi:hypothetical protein JOQ06_000721 [Pogonophryne albipinna]|uniref:VPS13-like middle region domain-containing protein n=1 Tax=Pogonophryne albipinna TaxID=1090488 RepID=A0AAD6AE03_9TELE|nr:hypothetical protein JOQ06_000721 [Pogonophryne albipinna]